MSLNNIVGRLNDSNGSDIFGSQIEQLDHDAEEVHDRVCQLVGEVLVKIGGNTQLLRFEQLELTKENIALKHQITQLKMVHLAEWEAVHQDFKAKMGVVSDKLKAIVDRFTWVKEFLLDPSIQQLRVNLKSITSNGSAVQGYHKATGIVRVRFEYDACLADEGCDSVFADWLKLTVDDGACAKKLDYPSYSRRGEVINHIVPLPQENTRAVIVPLVSALTPNQTDLMVRKFTQLHVEKYQALETATATMRAANAVLRAEKAFMIEVHPGNLGTLKLLFAAKFMENLHKAQLYRKTEESINSADRFRDAIDPRNEPHLLTDTKLQWVQEGYTQEAKLIQGLVIPLISTLEAFIAEYGKAVMESRASLLSNNKTTIEELIAAFERQLQIIKEQKKGVTDVADDSK